MCLRKVVLFFLLLVVRSSWAQSSVTEIKIKDGVHYITTAVDFPVTGTYLFEGGEPIVSLNGDGTGIYQLHELPKRAMIWGIECSKEGVPKFVKGYDSAAYILWYQFTTGATSDNKEDWVSVEFSIHFKTLKMYIQGERVKEYSDSLEK